MKIKKHLLGLLVICSFALVGCSSKTEIISQVKKEHKGIEVVSVITQNEQELLFKPSVKNVSDEPIEIQYAKPIAYYSLDGNTHPTQMRDTWEKTTLKPNQSLADVTSIHAGLKPGEYESTVTFRYKVDGEFEEVKVDFLLRVKE